MSQTNPSTPKTPRRPIMAIVNEKLAEKSAARGTPTPALTPSSSRLPQKIRGVSPSLLSTSIQVPPTQTPISSPLKNLRILQRRDRADDVDRDLDMAPELEPEAEPDETMISIQTSDPRRDLAPMNWKTFEQNYVKAIQELSDEEDLLVQDFQHLSEVSRLN